MIVLAVGDVVDAPGLKMLSRHLRSLKKLHGADFTVVNGENAAMTGITAEQAEDIFAAGADVITLGNHTWRRREILGYLDDCPYILRPANYPHKLPGRGAGVFEWARGSILVVNLIGRFEMDVGPESPFSEADRILEQMGGQTPLRIVDMHAEATSERSAMGWYLDGRVSGVFGTHTHIQTADERVLPGGTGFIADVGMTGPMNSVLGIKPQQSIGLFTGELPQRYEPAPGPCRLDGVIFDINEKSGLCDRIERVSIHD